MCLSSSICLMVNSLRQHDLKARLFSTVSASKVVREPIKRRPARHPQKRLQEFLFLHQNYPHNIRVLLVGNQKKYSFNKNGKRKTAGHGDDLGSCLNTVTVTVYGEG